MKEQEVTGINSEGDGIIRIDNKVCFVPYTTPGDIIEPKELTDKKSYFTANSFNLIKPSKERIEAPCPHFTKCGGCQLQHIKYSKQLSLKREQVIWAFKKTTKVENCEEIVSNTIPSPKEFNYRNRAILHKKGDDIGFYEKESHTICPIDKCLLLEEPISDGPLKAKSKTDLKDGEISIWLNSSGKSKIKQKEKRGTSINFSQINNELNEILKNHIVDIVTEIAKKKSTPSLLDLYCGDGNLSLNLASICSKIAGVDLSQSNIDRANDKIREMSLVDTNIRYIKDDCVRYCKSLKPGLFDILIVDPPRSGMKQVAKITAGLKFKDVIYLSCNPATQARDINFFLSQGYEIVSITPYDMFAQTNHVEILVHYRKKK